MTTTNPKEQAQAPGAPARPNPSAELESGELDKVVGGLKKNTGGRGKIGDPCDGGE
jgi:hypothetical protein